jgi:hypothetical protein
VIEQAPPRVLQLKVQLRASIPRFGGGPRLAIIYQSRTYTGLSSDSWAGKTTICIAFAFTAGITVIEEMDGMPFDEDAEDVPLSRFGFRPAERFLYEYDFADGWEAEIRVEKVIDEAVSDENLTSRCIAGREPAPPNGSGGPRRYAERRLDTVSPILTDDMRTVGDVLVRIADGDDNALADPETFLAFKEAASRLKSHKPSLAVTFPRAEINAAL